MDPAALAGFAAATLVLMLIPGPNVALIVATSLAHGRRLGLAAVAGTTGAMVPQLVLVTLGLGGVLAAAGPSAAWLRVAGVVYLAVLGLRALLVPPAAERRPPPAGRLFRRAVIVSATNPKTLAFYGAFFPQFLAADRPAMPQLAVLSALFLTIALVVDGGWALAADRVRGVVAGRERLTNRLSGGALLGGAALLALARGRQ